MTALGSRLSAPGGRGLCAAPLALLAALFAGLGLRPASLAAQGIPRAAVQPEVRVDVLTPPATVHLGGGVEIPLGYYTRLGVIGAGGVVRSSGVPVGSGRVDVLGRFMLDPFRETRWGLSVGGGVTARYDVGRGWREYLAVAVDLEGGRLAGGGLVPAVQVGLGGGTRVGVVLRRYAPGRR